MKYYKVLNLNELVPQTIDELKSFYESLVDVLNEQRGRGLDIYPIESKDFIIFCTENEELAKQEDMQTEDKVFGGGCNGGCCSDSCGDCE